MRLGVTQRGVGRGRRGAGKKFVTLTVVLRETFTKRRVRPDQKKPDFTNKGLDFGVP